MGRDKRYSADATSWEVESEMAAQLLLDRPKDRASLLLPYQRNATATATLPSLVGTPQVTSHRSPVTLQPPLLCTHGAPKLPPTCPLGSRRPGHPQLTNCRKHLQHAVRIPQALAPKSSVLGLFGLGAASRGSAAIPVLRSHGVATIAPHLCLHTHTLSLSSFLPPSFCFCRPWTAAARIRLARGSPAPCSQATRPCALSRLCSSPSRPQRTAFSTPSFEAVKTLRLH
ncbi:hypothetical protein EDB89DRAFT_1137149 [Lactarius sanguifluus]|nr:hypothetical protein EDB89DRAFT_1137149 [Lactarius sanguifluus]